MRLRPSLAMLLSVVVMLTTLSISGPYWVEGQFRGITLLNAQSVDETSVATQFQGADPPTSCVVYIEWGAGTSAGVIQIEEAFVSTYAGTWAQLQVVSWAAASVTDAIHLTGVYGAVRTRISTAIVGGTVTTRLYCRR